MPNVRLGVPSTLTIVPRDSNGVALAGRASSATSSDPAVFTIAGGQVIGHALGTANLILGCEGRQAIVTITVVADAEFTLLVADLAAMGVTVSRAYLAHDGLTPGGDWVDRIAGEVAPAQSGGLAYDPVTRGAYPAAPGGHNATPLGAPVAGGGKLWAYIGNTAGSGRVLEIVDPSSAAASTSGSLCAVVTGASSSQAEDADTSADKVAVYLGGGAHDLAGNAFFGPKAAWGYAGIEEPIGDADIHCLTLELSGDATERRATMDGWRSTGSRNAGAFAATVGPYLMRLPGPSASGGTRLCAALELDVPDASTVVGNAIVQRINRYARVEYGRVDSPWAGMDVTEWIGDSFTEASRIPTDFGLPVDTYGPAQAAAIWLRANGAPNAVAIAKGISGRSWRTYNTGDPADPSQDVVQDISIAEHLFWEGRLADETARRWVRVFQEDYNANRNSGATASDLAANIQAQALAVVQRSRAYLGAQANVRHLFITMGPSRLERLAGTADALYALRTGLPAGTMGDRLSTVLYSTPELNPFSHPENFCTSDGGIHPDANGSQLWGQLEAQLNLAPMLAA